MEVIRAKNPTVVFLAKTLINDARLEFVQRSIGFDHRWVVPRVGRGGGLVLYWKASINLKVEDSDRYYIDAVIDKNMENEWRLMGFFGEPDTARRHEAWAKLRIVYCMRSYWHNKARRHNCGITIHKPNKSCLKHVKHKILINWSP